MRKFGYHLTTGFVGTPYLCHVLSRFGYTDLAYELLNQESYPVLAVPGEEGRDDDLGALGRHQAGRQLPGRGDELVQPLLLRRDRRLDVPRGRGHRHRCRADAAGYKHVLIQPQPGGGLTHVRAALHSPYGEIVSAWQLTDADFRLQVTVPPNTRATVRIPARTLDQVTESGKALAGAAGIVSAKVEGGAAVIELGAGQYDFVSTGLNQAQAFANVRHVAGRLDIGCSLRELMADERAKAILLKHAGEAITTMRRVPPWVGDQTLDGLQRMAPHVLTPERLQAIQAELVAL